MSPTPRALPFAAGAGLAFCAWWAFAGTREEGVSSGWALTRPALRLSSASLAGPMRNDPATLELSGNRSADAPRPLVAGDVLTIHAEVPEGGTLLVRAGRTPGAGLAPTGGGPGGGPGPSPGGPNTRAATLTFDRGPSASLHGSGGLVCAPLPLTSATLTATVLIQNEGALVTTESGESRCSGARLTGPWSLRSGVERVRVKEVSLERGSQTTVLLSPGPWYTRGWAGGAAALGGGLLGLAAPRRPEARAALIPLIAAPFLAALPAAGWLEALRMLVFPEALLPLVVGAVLAAALGVFAIAGRYSLPKTLLFACAPLAVSFTLWLRYADARGWSLLAAAFVPLAGLAWANLHRVRGVGLWSWAAILLMLGLGELGVRHTRLDDTWVRTAGYERAAKEFQELLELKEYRSYPSEGFPVKPPEPRPGVHRIVALGGSSTGGAFQMDNINLFWPAKLDDQLSGEDWEVVNQGVGGWNSLHIRLYVESQLERLAPDILVLYVGHNDLMSSGPASHRTLLARYRQPAQTTLTTLSDTLNASRLFVGFKFFLLSWRGDAAVAVPLADARENLSVILEAAAKQSIHVLLVSEGLNPDPAPMAPYFGLEAELADRYGQRAFDAAARFAVDANPDDFIDDCHLTVGGHERLASWILAELRSAGWIPA